MNKDELINRYTYLIQDVEKKKFAIEKSLQELESVCKQIIDIETQLTSLNNDNQSSSI